MIIFSASFLFACSLLQDAKAPLPSDEEQRNARKMLHEIFEKEYRETDPDKLAAFAKKLLNQGNEAQKDPVGRYAILLEASEVAAKAGDLETAFGAVDRIDEFYAKSNALKLKEDALSMARSRLKTTEQKQRYADFSFRLACDALKANDFSLARSSARTAETYARLARNQGIYDRAKDLVREIPVYERAHREVEKALLTLSANPEDPDANKAYGTYLCFIQGSWKKGLGFLAASGDEKLREIAKLEAEATNAGAQISLAELYDELAEESRNNPLKERNLLARALKWYRTALQGDLKGLAKIKAEKRVAKLMELAIKETPLAAGGSLTPKPQLVLKQGDRLDRDKTPPVAKHSIRIEASLKDQAEGVILAHGGGRIGYVLYIENGKLNYCARLSSTAHTVTAPQTLPSANFIVGAVMTTSGQVTLFVNGRAVATGKVPGSLPHKPSESLCVGKDPNYSIGRYRSPFEYKGTINSVRIQYGND